MFCAFYWFKKLDTHLLWFIIIYYLHCQSRVISIPLSHTTKEATSDFSTRQPKYILVDVQYEPSLGSSIASVVSLSKHITYIATGSLRGFCIPHSGLVQRVPFLHNTGRWPLGAARQVDHSQPLVSFALLFIKSYWFLTGLTHIVSINKKKKASV